MNKTFRALALLSCLGALAATAQAATATAVFAGGCFWCIEADFEKLAGVTGVESGYTAGKTANPTYEQVSNGHTGHTEAVRVIYDPAKVSYAELVEYFLEHCRDCREEGAMIPLYRLYAFFRIEPG